MSGIQQIEAQNLAEIEGLNQRGGRMLSVVDLMAAGTLSAEMAGYLLFAMKRGASLLACAGPGGAGKTALLGAILNLLPPGERLVTVGRPSVLSSNPAKPACFLVHEIGSGPYYGYLWGKDVPAFLERAGQGYRVAATIHADHPDEIQGDLNRLGVSDGFLSHVGVMGFIQSERRGGTARHTVHSIYEQSGQGMPRLVFRSDGSSFVQESPSTLADGAADKDELQACSEFFEHLSCPPDLANVRREILEFYAEEAS